MVLDFIFQIWRRLNASVQWRLLWLFNHKFMVSVAGIVYDRDDRILLQRHRHWVTDAWGLPGGIVESRESLENAFSREVLEETGLAISNVELISLVSGYHLRMEAYFRAKLLETDDEQIIKLQEEEIIEARFYSADTLFSNILQILKVLILQEKVLRSKCNNAKLLSTRLF